MFTYAFPSGILDRLKDANRKSPSVWPNLMKIGDNPYTNAVKIDNAAIGGYYVKCGRWCILYNVDQDAEQIHIYNIVHSAFLYKLLSGQIDPSTPTPGSAPQA